MKVGIIYRKNIHTGREYQLRGRFNNVNSDANIITNKHVQSQQSIMYPQPLSNPWMCILRCIPRKKC